MNNINHKEDWYHDVEVIENFESYDAYMREWEDWYHDVDEEMFHQEIWKDILN